MRYVAVLLAVGALAAACSTLPLPGGVNVSSGVPLTCPERLTESSCIEGSRCRWINDSRRADGTYATAHCEGES
jgi:hypothetical protein